MIMVNINIRMEDSLKQQFESCCNELGLNMTAAFNVFARAVVREQGIPFDLKLDTPNKETLDAMEEVRQMKQDTSIGKTYANANEMMEDLLS